MRPRSVWQSWKNWGLQQQEKLHLLPELCCTSGDWRRSFLPALCSIVPSSVNSVVHLSISDVQDVLYAEHGHTSLLFLGDSLSVILHAQNLAAVLVILKKMVLVFLPQKCKRFPCFLVSIPYGSILQMACSWVASFQAAGSLLTSAGAALWTLCASVKYKRLPQMFLQFST